MISSQPGRTLNPESIDLSPPVRGASLETPGPIGILFITDQLCELGGAERVLLRIIERLPRERFSPHIITFKINRALPIEDFLSCPLTVMPLGRTYNLNALRIARRIHAYVHNHRIRITHTFHETSDVWAGPIAKLSGCPILISSRRDMGVWRGAKHRVAYRCLSRYFDQVQTVSEEVRRHSIREDRLASDRVVTVYNGVDLPAEDPGFSRIATRERLGLSRFRHVVTSVGHLRSVKGFDVFLRAAALVRRQLGDTIAFVIAGDEIEPGYTKTLTTLAATLGLEDSLVLLGDVSNVRDLLRASDVFCLLSRSEGLSNALLEAMACGLPSVATAVGGNPELIVPGQTGFLVENGDAEAAAAALLHLLMHPDIRSLLGAKARKVTEANFTTDIMMRRLTESYDQLLRGAVHGNT